MLNFVLPECEAEHKHALNSAFPECEAEHKHKTNPRVLRERELGISISNYYGIIPKAGGRTKANIELKTNENMFSFQLSTKGIQLQANSKNSY